MSDSNGWIKLHRSLLHWEWYDDKNVKILFLHCLLKANHKDKKYKGKLVKSGSFLTSRELLKIETGLTERQIRTALNKLKSTNELSVKSNRQGTEIVILNYKKYQQTTNKKSNERPTSDQRATSNKNDKKDKNDKNIPTWDEFLEHALDKCESANLVLNESQCKLKYEAWKDAGWRKTQRGNLVEIKNWKNTLTNSIQYMSSEKKKSGIYKGMSSDDFLQQQWSEVMEDAKRIGDDIHE